MKTQINYKFILKPQPNKDGLNPVYLRAFQHGRKIEIATSIIIQKEDWSESKQRVKKRSRQFEKANTILDAYDKKALKCILENFINSDDTLTLQQFKNYMQGNIRNDDSFTDFMFNYLEENKSRLRTESWWSYRSQITKMLKFKSYIGFANITEKFVNEYQHYMLHTLKNNENTVSKSLRSLRTFVNIAMRYGYIKNNPFKYITIKKVDGKRDFLSVNELNKLSKAYFSNKITDPKEKEIMRYFLFSCYTGLRYSDLKSLTPNAIYEKKLRITMHKTSYIVTIPLSQKALSLLAENEPLQSEYVFRVYCNKVTNRILKKIGERYKIRKKLTCHTARHTPFYYQLKTSNLQRIYS